jgi:hypothetical protein
MQILSSRLPNLSLSVCIIESNLGSSNIPIVSLDTGFNCRLHAQIHLPVFHLLSCTKRSGVAGSQSHYQAQIGLLLLFMQDSTRASAPRNQSVFLINHRNTELVLFNAPKIDVWHVRVNI